MPMRLRELVAAGTGIAALAAMPVLAGDFGLGHPATPEEIAGWAIDIPASGEGLPPGSGSVADGKALYETRCASCHGGAGEGGIGDQLVGGEGSLATDKPVKTIGSYWPYATTLFDYVRRAMPLDAPQSLSAGEVYAVTAYLLSQNGLLPEDATVDAASLPKVEMPNRNGFVPDPRPDVTAARCMTDCPAFEVGSN